MKVAVAYDNGMIFQHFGHSGQFKVFFVEDKVIKDSRIIETKESGHAALSAFLAKEEVNVLICDYIGKGAIAALGEAGIEVFSGAEGEADAAVEAYLAGKLESEGVKCGHHADGSCESDCCSAAEECMSESEGGCCGCHGGCHKLPPIEGKNVGKTCKTHYKGTFNDGTQFDSSYDRGEPLEFVCGAGMMIRGFDAAVANMEVGQIIDVHLMPEEAYGMPDPAAVFTLAIKDLPGSEELEAGQRVVLSNAYGQPVPVEVLAKDDVSITFDANHEMAGKELNFRIELVEVK